MRRISRIDRSIGLLRRQSNTRIPSPYLCLTCKHQTTAFSTSTLRPAPSDEKAPFTEKVRRRIWGTDKPPGLADPYGDTSVFDRTKRAREHQEEARSQELEEPPKEVERSVSDDAIYTGGYEPATSWTELQWVGGDPVWQPEEDFWGFLPARVTTDPEKITAALHRAMVEVFVMQQAGKPLYELSNTFPAYQSMNDWTDDVQITPSPSGTSLQFAEDISLQQVMEAAELHTKNEGAVEPTESQEDIDADRSEVDPLKDEVIPNIEHHPENTEPTESEEDINADRSTEDPLHRVETKTYHDVISSWDPAWLQVSLQNPEVKFAVLKRTMQLTGIRFPDAAIKSANTAEALLTHLVIPPKPRKLVEALAQNPDLLELENVKIYPAKRSFYDKEREIGRLKVIEKELEARGLDL